MLKIEKKLMISVTFERATMVQGLFGFTCEKLRPISVTGCHFSDDVEMKKAAEVLFEQVSAALPGVFDQLNRMRIEDNTEQNPKT